MKSRRDFIQKLSAGILVPGMVGFRPSEKQENHPINQNLTGDAFWDQIRTQFPLTKERVYLNNGTFGPAPFRVTKALEESLYLINSTGEYGQTDAEREKLAAFLGVQTKELSLTHNTTEGINIMAWGIPLERGDEVILTKHDHAGNALPWLNRARLQGIVLKTFEPASTQEENLKLISGLISSKTKVLAIPHVTCTTGHVFPIRELCELARSRGVFSAIDGAHGAGSLELNVKNLGCDFYAGCCHKWMNGPSGTAFLYVKEDLLDVLQPYQIGGASDSGWDMTTDPPSLKGYAPSAHRYDYGTQSTALMKGVAAAIDFQEELGREKIESRIRELNQYLYEGVLSMGSRIEMLTSPEPESRISMVSFRPKNVTYQLAGNELGKLGFRIRQVPEGGVNAIRVSTHIYNSKSEIDNFLKVLPKVLG